MFVCTHWKLLENISVYLIDFWNDRYLCKHNMIPNLSAKALKQSNFGVVCVCRAPESDALRNSVRNEWKNCLWIAEDTAIIDASIEKVNLYIIMGTVP
jgi:hypothetical protein